VANFETAIASGAHSWKKSVLYLGYHARKRSSETFLRLGKGGEGWIINFSDNIRIIEMVSVCVCVWS